MCSSDLIGTVGCLWFYGYLHFAKPEDALLLSDFTMLKTVPGEDYKIPDPRAEFCQGLVSDDALISQRLLGVELGQMWERACSRMRWVSEEYIG